MRWARRRWRNARWLERAAIVECGVAAVAIVLLVLFSAIGSGTAAVVVECVAALASILAIVFSLRINSLL